MELMNELPIQKVTLDEQVSYHCNCCGDCCRHIKDAVMLDSLDLYNLAKHFKKSVMDIINRYATPMSLDETGYPIFLLNTSGKDDACVFLKNNRCTAQAAKPRTCRLYPFTADLGKGAEPLRYYLCLEKPHHFKGGEIQVGNWLDRYFSDEDRRFLATEFQCIPEFAACYRALSEELHTMALTQIMFFRYFNLSPKRPFWPQYEENNVELLRSLSKLVQQERGRNL